ncbi:hypothetical protein L202_08458 [Cryptococcus amylolentus CBS 6039]|uniref:Uncharacterized protein n=1 Tax=Cryptococcus amylolentus CBS 6039 TaxID=1295533 RepID=A0A1E3H9S4_9TREE|nr:hypothetical protein L202_08458 [Cryptococcus amylolentus CBS 6039]ODN73063.1 hypothetical protein L202_08458 [Cryptococcus amylolentus CBS 6039]
MSQFNNQDVYNPLDRYREFLDSHIRTIQNRRITSEDQSAESRGASSVSPSVDMSPVASFDPNDIEENVIEHWVDVENANTPSTVILEDEDLVGDDENRPPTYDFGPASNSAAHPTMLGFMFSERQTGIPGESVVILCTNSSPQGASYARWMLDQVDSGGRDRLWNRISMDDAITLYLGDLDEDRRDAISGWMLIGLDQFWRTGQSMFTFGLRGASVDEDAAQNRER